MQLAAERRGANACRVRRAQMILASAQGLSAKPMAQLVGCAVQTVRNVLHAFQAQGLGCVPTQSTRPKSVAPILDAAHCERLPHILQQSPRTSGPPTGVWTLGLAAQVCEEQGVTERLMRQETSRRAVQRLRTTWKRAKHGSTSPAPHYARKKRGAIACVPWRGGLPTGSEACRTRSGGAAWRRPTGIPGQTPSRCAGSKTSRTAPPQSPKRSRVMGSYARTHRACSSAVGTGVRSVR